MKKNVILVVVIVVIAIVVAMNGRFKSSTKKALHEMSHQELTKALNEVYSPEEVRIRSACWVKWIRISDQLQRRLEDAQLHGRGETVKKYHVFLRQWAYIRQLLESGRVDPAILLEDIQSLENYLKNEE